MRTRLHRLKLLWKIYCLWNYFPELRLCQLLNVVVSEVDANVRDVPNSMFYTTDNTILFAVDEFRKDYI